MPPDLRRRSNPPRNRPFALAPAPAVHGQTGCRVNDGRRGVLGACQYGAGNAVGRLPFSLSSQRNGVRSFSNTRFMALKTSLAVTFFNCNRIMTALVSMSPFPLANTSKESLKRVAQMAHDFAEREFIINVRQNDVRILPIRVHPLRGGLGLRYRQSAPAAGLRHCCDGQTGVGINRGAERPDLSGPAPRPVRW